MMRWFPLAVALLVVMGALALPTGTSHRAANPPQWMTRILHDFNDDWGSDASQSSPQDGHDLIALDLQESYNATLGKDTLVVRLLMNFGYDGDLVRPELREVVSFKANGQPVSREFRTTDNTRFTGSFDHVRGPVSILKSDGSPDGSRFYLEGTLLRDGLGLAVGDKVSDFFVQGYGGTQKADHMVGGYTLGGQTVNDPPPSEQSDPASYRVAEYTLRGPVMYVKSEIDPARVDAQPGDNKTITWKITNLLGTPQTVTLTTAKPTGVAITLHGSRYAPDELTFQLAAGLTATVHAYVLPGAQATSGPIELTATTDLGGRVSRSSTLTVAAADPSSPPGTDAPTEEPQGSPGAALLGAVVALLGVAAWRRRGR